MPTMNILKSLTTLRSSFARFIETSHSFRWAQRTEKVFDKRLVIEALSERELLRVQGEEVVPFLQGLITNDMSHLQVGRSSIAKTSSMYTMFLNKAGRVLYDSIIYRTQAPNTFLIECDRNVSKELRQHLRLYRVRRKIEIDTVDEYRPWIVFNPVGTCMRRDTVAPVLNKEFISTPDPRVRDLGTRVIAKSTKSWKDLAAEFTNGDITVAKPTNDCNYRIHRYRYGVGEGVLDMPPGKCFPLEANCDFLHGVSFHKGCYLGQELTARVHHTGVVRKRIMPLRLTGPLSSKSVTNVENEAGNSVGTIRGAHLDRALALLRVEQVLSASKLMVDGQQCFVEKPYWWPTEQMQADQSSSPPQPSSSKNCLGERPNDDEVDEVTLNVKDEEAEIARLELPLTTEGENAAKDQTAVDDERIAKIKFHCASCNMLEMVHYFGKTPPFVYGVRLLEDTFVMRDPFQPPPPRWKPKAEYFVALGANCSQCERTVCKDLECSFYYTRTYCLRCAAQHVKSFPLEVQAKLRRQLNAK